LKKSGDVLGRIQENKLLAALGVDEVFHLRWRSRRAGGSGRGAIINWRKLVTLRVALACLQGNRCDARLEVQRNYLYIIVKSAWCHVVVSAMKSSVASAGFLAVVVLLKVL